MIYLYFFVLVFVSVFFHSFWVGAIFLGLLILILFFSRIFFKFNFKINLLYIVLLFFIINCVIFIKYYLYFSNQKVYNQNYDGNGTIVDILDDKRCSFEDENNQKFILNSNQNYDLGDKIFIVGNYQKIDYNNDYFDFNLDIKKFDFYPGYYFMQGIYGNIYEKNSVYLGQGDLSFPLKIKKYFRNIVINTYGKNEVAGLVLGMTIGDKSLISKENYQNFINSSLVHIVAVSGSNLAILIVCLSVVLFLLPYYIRIFAILVACIIFSFICGLSSSVLRALLMSGLIFMSLFFGRKTNTLRIILYALIFMLLINPFALVYDLGFGLSFAAVWGIYFMSKVKIFKSNKLNNYLNPIFGAYLFTLPIIILYTSKIGLLGFIPNIIAIPFVSLIMIYGFVSSLIYQVLPLDFLVNLGNFLVNSLYFIAKIFSENNLYIIVEDIYVRIYIFLVFILIFRKVYGNFRN